MLKMTIINITSTRLDVNKIQICAFQPTGRLNKFIKLYINGRFSNKKAQLRTTVFEHRLLGTGIYPVYSYQCISYTSSGSIAFKSNTVQAKAILLDVGVLYTYSVGSPTKHCFNTFDDTNVIVTITGTCTARVFTDRDITGVDYNISNTKTFTVHTNKQQLHIFIDNNYDTYSVIVNTKMSTLHSSMLPLQIQQYDEISSNIVELQTRILDLQRSDSNLEGLQLQIDELKNEDSNLEGLQLQIDELKNEAINLEGLQLQIDELKNEDSNLEGLQLQIDELKNNGDNLESLQLQIDELQDNSVNTDSFVLSSSSIVNDDEVTFSQVTQSNVSIVDKHYAINNNGAYQLYYNLSIQPIDDDVHCYKVVMVYKNGNVILRKRYSALDNIQIIDNVIFEAFNEDEISVRVSAYNENKDLQILQGSSMYFIRYKN